MLKPLNLNRKFEIIIFYLKLRRKIIPYLNIIFSLRRCLIMLHLFFYYIKTVPYSPNCFDNIINPLISMTDSMPRSIPVLPTGKILLNAENKNTYTLLSIKKIPPRLRREGIFLIFCYKALFNI